MLDSIVKNLESYADGELRELFPDLDNECGFVRNLVKEAFHAGVKRGFGYGITKVGPVPVRYKCSNSAFTKYKK